jgi:hypothetical protein
MILGVGVGLYAPSDRPGLLFLGSAAAYGIGRLGLELLRADAASTALSTRLNVGVFGGAGADFTGRLCTETAISPVGATGKEVALPAHAG